jgi:hypothetical protein
VGLKLKLDPLGSTVAFGVTLTLPENVCVPTVFGVMVTLNVPLPLSTSEVGATEFSVKGSWTLYVMGSALMVLLLASVAEKVSVPEISETLLEVPVTKKQTLELLPIATESPRAPRALAALRPSRAGCAVVQLVEVIEAMPLGAAGEETVTEPL